MKRILTLLLISLSFVVYSKDKNASISGTILNKGNKEPLAYVNISLLNQTKDKVLKGTITEEDGFFVMKEILQGQYIIKVSYVGFIDYYQEITIGKLNEYFDLGTILLEQSANTLADIIVNQNSQELDRNMDKKTYKLDQLTSQQGGSVLEALKGLPGITTTREGQVELRGSNKVAILLDGQQSALTGFGSQSGLDNIPASAIERIEILNNPSAKHDANGQAGIINVIFKKQQKKGFNGQVGMTTGIGSLWEKVKNMPGIDPQYKRTPKYNPSLALNYRGEKTNLFLQSDFLWHKKINKNEFYERTYSDQTIVKQQYLENRTQNIPTVQIGIDWFLNDNNQLTFAGNYSRKAYVDRGSLPYYNDDFSERKRLWNFIEDELATSLGLTGNYKRFFKQPGHQLGAHASYTHIKKEEYYSLNNITPQFEGADKFDLMANQQITDFNIDYTKPLKQGRIEIGSKFRWRYLPINIQYYPGLNSLIDVNAGGWANYNEVIPAVYTNYLYEHKKLEIEAGLRAEYVNINYEVTPEHNTYSSDGYEYFKLFPSVRLGYNVNENNKISLFYNKRVDRPDEKDLRVFPKYDDPEILKIGNPSLKPQYTQSIELGYRNTWSKNYFYVASYYRYTTDYISSIFTSSPSTGIIYSTPQNTGSGTNSGLEIVYNQEVSNRVTLNFNINGYFNQISAFEVNNSYPYPVIFKGQKKENYAGNLKVNTNIQLSKSVKLHALGTYLSKDIIPQGEIGERYSFDIGIKKSIQKGKGEVFANGVDLFNTMQMKQKIDSEHVTVNSTDYLETQVFKIGYSYKF